MSKARSRNQIRTQGISSPKSGFFSRQYGFPTIRSLSGWKGPRSLNRGGCCPWATSLPPSRVLQAALLLAFSWFLCLMWASTWARAAGRTTPLIHWVMYLSPVWFLRHLAQFVEPRSIILSAIWGLAYCVWKPARPGMRGWDSVDAKIYFHWTTA